MLQKELQLELEHGTLAVLDVEGFPLRRRWYAVHRHGKRLSKVATVFLNYLLEEGEEEVAHLLTAHYEQPEGNSGSDRPGQA